MPPEEPAAAPAPAATPPAGATPPAAPATPPAGATPPAAPATPPAGGEPPASPESLASFAPETWREIVAKGDEKRLNVLKRMGSLDVLTENFFEAQDRIRSGELASPLPEKPTEAQLTAYRELHGIPATAKDYKLEMGEGVVLGDADKAIIAPLLEVAHQQNVPAKAMSSLTNAFLQSRQAEADGIAAQDSSDKLATDVSLKKAWGGDYQTNINYVNTLLNKMPKETRDLFVDARLPNGMALFNDPEVLVFFANTARQAMPAASLVPAGDPAPRKTLESRKLELEKMMGTPEWAKDNQAQAEYMQIVDALQGLQSQGA